MLTAPIAKALLEYDPGIIPVIFECEDYFEIAIGLQPIAPQRMTTPPQARQFKTLGAAYSYLRNFLNYRGDVHIRLVDEPPTGTGETL